MEWSIGTHGDTSVKFWDAQDAPEKDKVRRTRTRKSGKGTVRGVRKTCSFGHSARVRGEGAGDLVRARDAHLSTLVDASSRPMPPGAPC